MLFLELCDFYHVRFSGFIVKDVLREEQRFLEDNAISEKTVNKLIGTEAARWYKQHLNKEGL